MNLQQTLPGWQTVVVECLLDELLALRVVPQVVDGLHVVHNIRGWQQGQTDIIQNTDRIFQSEQQKHDTVARSRYSCVYSF